MKAIIIITDDSGNKWEYELPLTGSSSASNTPESRKKRVKGSFFAGKSAELTASSQQPDFSLPLRPFIKRHASGLAGPKKFTLLLAHLAGGNVNTEITSAEIQKQWNKMTGLMGGTFNPAHSSRARDSGWVDSPKFGTYKLLPGWEGALSNG